MDNNFNVQQTSQQGQPIPQQNSLQYTPQYQQQYTQQQTAPVQQQAQSRPSSAQPQISTGTVPTNYKKPVNNKNKNGNIIRTSIIACITAIITCLIIVPITTCVSKSNVLDGGGISITALGDDATLAEAVAVKCLPSVLSVNNYRVNKAGTQQQYATGSGVIISQDGYVLTNQHVVSGASEVTALVGGEEVTADIVGEDVSTDVAVIKIRNASNLTAMEIADSDQVKVGEWVMALGNPLGYEQSISVGIVSATGRSTILEDEEAETSRVYYNLIQTDAAINSGNSGGALVNKEGKLIGINSVGVNPTIGAGIGFAIPSNYVYEVASILMSGGTISHASIGLAMNSITASDVKQYDLKVDSGAFVTDVAQGGPADKAGIQAGDVITEIDGTKIAYVDEAILAVKSHNPGDTISVTINRHGRTLNVNVTLGGD